MYRIFFFVLLMVLLFWLADRFFAGVKQFLLYQNRKAKREQLESHQALWRRLMRAAALAVMIFCLLFFGALLVMYFSGNFIVPFRRSVFVTVALFLAAYWIYAVWHPRDG